MVPIGVARGYRNEFRTVGFKDIMKFRNHQQKKNTEAFVAHFQLLGLRLGECRSNVIRSAAQAMAVALNRKGNNSAREYGALDHFRHFADDLHRAEIAIATYRLLDPRERTDVFERIQLCYPIDRDDAESQATSTGSLIHQMPNLSKKTHRQSLSIKAIEDDQTETQDSFKKVTGNLFMDERRSIVRSMRNSNELTLRGLSPLGWLKSQLGI